MPEITKEILPPQNLEAEMAVLGSMMLDEKALAVAIELLVENYFYKDSHRKVFQAVLMLKRNGILRAFSPYVLRDALDLMSYHRAPGRLP